ncbi:MAG: S1 RNA-binding domain-containing protein [Patescibacteria group bacterium]|nr:S1 RNA-binding domain-containing protein [Patescibacteria group bacterium]
MTITTSPKDELATNSPMDELLAKTKTQIPEIGNLVKGSVIDISKNAIYLDLGILGTGLVMGREMKDGLGISDNLKKGDTVEATVIELENEDGYMELSLREAGYEKTWDEIERKKKEEETIETKILAANRGGLMVEINGITGFLPVSQLANENYPRVEDGDKNKILQLLNGLLDKMIDVRIIDIDRENEKLIVSEKATLSEKEEKEIKKFKVGEIVEGTVSGIVDFGAFIKFPPVGKTMKNTDSKDVLEGLIHISELAWQLISNPHDIVRVGEKVKCKIIGIDNNRISFSVRALEKDPWSQVNKKYKVGSIVKGEITKFNPFGAFVQLDKDIHGLAHISELNRLAHGKNIEDLLSAGESYKFKILSIEPKNHRMGLSPIIATNQTTKDEQKEKVSKPSSNKVKKETVVKKKEVKKDEEDKKDKSKKKKVESKKKVRGKKVEGKKAVKTKTSTKKTKSTQKKTIAKNKKKASKKPATAKVANKKTKKNE